MSKYRKISPRIWSDEKIRNLSDDAQFAFIFCLSHPALTMLGAMRGSVPGLASEKAWSVERMQKALEECFAADLLRYDPAACFIIAPKFLRYNKPESPNVVKSWGAVYYDLPECSLKLSLFEIMRDFVECYPEAFGKAFRQAFRGHLENDRRSLKIKPQADPAEPPASSCELYGNNRRFEFPIRGGGVWALPADKLRELQAAFPGVDIDGELKRAAAWLETNPEKMKSPGWMVKFLQGWLSNVNKPQTGAKQIERFSDQRSNFGEVLAV